MSAHAHRSAPHSGRGTGAGSQRPASAPPPARIPPAAAPRLSAAPSSGPPPREGSGWSAAGPARRSMRLCFCPARHDCVCFLSRSAAMFARPCSQSCADLVGAWRHKQGGAPRRGIVASHTHTRLVLDHTEPAQLSLGHTNSLERPVEARAHVHAESAGRARGCCAAERAAAARSRMPALRRQEQQWPTSWATTRGLR